MIQSFARPKYLMYKAKEKRTLLDCLQKLSDWKRTVKAIAFLKRHAQKVKGLPVNGEVTSVEQRKEAEMFMIKCLDVKCQMS